MRDGPQINGQALLDAGIWRYVTKSEFVVATRSAYGRKAFQISTRPPVAGRAFTNTGKSMTCRICFDV